MSAEPAVLVRGLRVAYGPVVALNDVDLVLEEGQSIAVVGPSGSGKSSLLTTLAGLQAPTAGTVELLGERLSRLPPAELQQLRARRLGLVLQNPGRNLLTLADARENLLIVQGAAGGRRREHLARAAELLTAVGLEGAGRKKVAQLSGGEQQRLALAVAMANRPALLLADEPTSQLDRATGAHIADLLQEAHRGLGMALLVVTHDDEVAARFDRVVRVRDGELLPEEPR